MYNYLIVLLEITLILIKQSISECKFNITLYSPTILFQIQVELKMSSIQYFHFLLVVWIFPLVLQNHKVLCFL